MAEVFDGLTPPYRTIVADPPWAYDEGWPGASTSPNSNMNRGVVPNDALLRRKPLPYQSMTVEQIAALPVVDLAAADAHLYVWTTNRYLRHAFDVVTAWGFTYSTTLVWAKLPMGLGPGGAFSITTEFVIFARRGSLRPLQRQDSTWWQWSRTSHSEKPAAFLDVLEQVSPGPYVELFARAPRLGWDSWGKGYEVAA